MPGWLGRFSSLVPPIVYQPSAIWSADRKLMVVGSSGVPKAELTL